MAYATVTKQLQELKQLKNEVHILRSLMISILGEDEEGVYRPQFVQKILKACKEVPTHKFTGVRSFLAQVRKV